MITQESDISDPLAAIVKMTPNGIVFTGVFSWVENSQGLWETKAPALIDFAESMTDPPPTARIKSMSFSLTI